jgi:hypothetical protein
MLIERPLATLPADHAQRFVCAMIGPAQRVASLADPHLITVGRQRVAASWQEAGGAAAFQPIGLFGYRARTDQLGSAYCVGILGEQRADVLETIFLAIARTAARAGHAQLVFATPDRRHERCAVDLPAALQLPTTNRVFDLANLEAFERSLAATRAPFAWAA